MKWMPHSVFSAPRQRPARGSSPAFTAEVQGAPEADVVGIGSRVRYALNGAERTVTIVGHDEADPAAGLIAFTAPLGRALMGAETGDLVEFQDREDAIEILAADADPEVRA